jgi:predicted DNA-binding transcriptional regulator YafY
MRAERLISIILSLQVRGQISTSDLAERLEVSVRTIHRDMEVLSTAGIPVYALRGRHGGWALPEEYRGSARWLSAEEVRVLSVLSPARILDDLGLAGSAESAWHKLIAALPASHRDEATRIQERIHVDTSTWKPQVGQTPFLPLIKHAVLQEHLVRFDYRRADGTTISRTIAPLGLVAKGSIWYVVALCEEDLRTYRLSRIERADLLPDTFARPPDFDLEAYWQASKTSLAARLPQYGVELRVESGTIEALRQNLQWGRIQHVSSPDAEGWQHVSVMFELFSYALTSVLSLGDQVEVLHPADLREAVVEAHRRALARYKLPVGT